MIPKVREGLLAADHSKRGRRFVTMLDPPSGQVTLLEDWEHAILVLCDGTRDGVAIAELLAPAVEGQAIDVDTVMRCLRSFERQRLIHPLPPSVGEQTAAEIRRALDQFNRETMKTGELRAGAPSPFVSTGEHAAAGLDPTVVSHGSAVAVGTTLVLAGAQSLLDQEGTSTGPGAPIPIPRAIAGDQLRAGGSASSGVMKSERRAALLEQLEVIEQELAQAEEEAEPRRVRFSRLDSEPTLELSPRQAPELVAALDAPTSRMVAEDPTLAPVAPAADVRRLVRRFLSTSSGKRPSFEHQEVEQLVAHLRRLETKLERRLQCSALVVRLEAELALFGRKKQPRLREVAAREEVLALIAEAFLGGRCPECLSRVPIPASGSVRCSSCGFRPP